MRKTIFLFVLFTALLTIGCLSSGIGLSEKSSLPALDGNWNIKLAYSGGIVGLSRSIEVSSDGKYIVIDERANKTITGEFSADELSKLKEQVASSEYYPNNKPEGGCADCFAYDLDIQGNEESFVIQLDDISLPDSGLGALVNYLRGLIDAAL